VTLNNVLPGQLFYFRVQTASGGGALSGNYGLLVNMGNQAIDPIAPPNTTVTEQPNRGGGSSNMSTEERIRLGEIEGFGDDLLVSEMSSTAASTDLKPALWAEVPWIVFAMADWLGEGDAPTVPSRDRFSQLKLFDRALASLQVRKG
jgi:hypothetical protein